MSSILRIVGRSLFRERYLGRLVWAPATYPSYVSSTASRRMVRLWGAFYLLDRWEGHPLSERWERFHQWCVRHQIGGYRVLAEWDEQMWSQERDRDIEYRAGAAFQRVNQALWTDEYSGNTRGAADMALRRITYDDPATVYRMEITSGPGWLRFAWDATSLRLELEFTDAAPWATWRYDRIGTGQTWWEDWDPHHPLSGDAREALETVRLELEPLTVDEIRTGLRLAKESYP